MIPPVTAGEDRQVEARAQKRTALAVLPPPTSRYCNALQHAVGWPSELTESPSWKVPSKSLVDILRSRNETKKKKKVIGGKTAQDGEQQPVLSAAGPKGDGWLPLTHLDDHSACVNAGT